MKNNCLARASSHLSAAMIKASTAVAGGQPSEEELMQMLHAEQIRRMQNGRKPLMDPWEFLKSKGFAPSPEEDAAHAVAAAREAEEERRRKEEYDQAVADGVAGRTFTPPTPEPNVPQFIPGMPFSAGIPGTPLHIQRANMLDDIFTKKYHEALDSKGKEGFGFYDGLRPKDPTDEQMDDPDFDYNAYLKSPTYPESAYGAADPGYYGSYQEKADKSWTPAAYGSSDWARIQGRRADAGLARLRPESFRYVYPHARSLSGVPFSPDAPFTGGIAWDTPNSANGRAGRLFAPSPASTNKLFPSSADPTTVFSRLSVPSPLPDAPPPEVPKAMTGAITGGQGPSLTSPNPLLQNWGGPAPMKEEPGFNMSGK